MGMIDCGTIYMSGSSSSNCEFIQFSSNMKSLILAELFVFMVIQPCLLLPLSDNGESNVHGDRCNNCQAAVGIVEQKFSSADRNKASENFLQTCAGIEKLSGVCSNINSTFFNEIYKYLEETFRPNGFCVKTNECSTSMSVVPAIQILQSLPKGEDSPECELCKELMKQVVSEVTEDDFHETLLGVCEQMDSFKHDCKRLADEYYPLLHDYLLDKLNFKAVCSFIGLCSGPGFFTAPLPVPAVKVIPNVQPTPHPVRVPSSVGSSNFGGSYSLFPNFNPSFNSPWNNNYGSSPALALPALALPAAAALPAFAFLG